MVLWRDRVLAPLLLMTVAVCGFYALDLGGDRQKLVLCWVVAPLTDLGTFLLSRRLYRNPDLPPANRRFWRAMGVAGLLFATGDSYQLGWVLSHPGHAGFTLTAPQSLLGVLGVVLVCGVGLMHPSRWWSRDARIRVALDAAIILSAAGSAIWCVLTRSSMAHAGLAGYATSIFGCGILLIGGFLAVKLGLSGSSPIAWQAAVPLVVCCLVQAVGNALLPSVGLHGLVLPSLLILIPCVLTLVAPRLQTLAVRSRGRVPGRAAGAGRRYSLLPYLGTVICAAALIAVLAGQGLGVSAWGALAGLLLNVALVVARQMLALAENTTLLDQLDESLAEIRRRERRQEALLRHASDITAIIGTDGIVKYMNPAVERIIGGSLDEFVDRNWLDLIHPDDVERVAAEMDGVFAEPGAKAAFELRAQHEDESWRWLSVVAVNLVEERGIGGVVMNARDVTEERELRERLRFQAGHDALTGLANRRQFTDRIRAAGAAEVTVLLVDLNGFKQINDTYGHATGDAVLRHVAEQLLAATGDGDLSARLGGDEFAVLVGSGTQEAHDIAERLRSALARPVEIGGQRLAAGASIGVAAGRADHPDNLLHLADLRMYADKQRSREFAS
ncbi:diguanylate cyclase domain-containing protein [Actinoplanes sp. NPDC020271]|uniref:diguanylate cyclase domain-containing protein n=1 Tax=Actinoplanes sp. NPDC020271 TaxID=3363896 RepID=UPI0037B48051